MPSSPIVEEANLVSFAILSNGSEIPGTYEVLSIRVESHVNRIAEAEIIIRDGSTAQQDFEITDSDTFKPGTKIEIKLGYNSKNDSVFTGIVVKQTIRVDEHSGSRLQVICKDEALKMTVTRKNGIYTDSKDSAIIEQIAGTYSLSTSVTATSVEHKEVVQYYTTDWDFVMSRAEVNGMIVTTDSGKLTVAKPAVSDSPALQLRFGYDVIEFDGELDATYQYSGVEGNAWDMSSQSVITATADSPSVNTQGDITGDTLAEVLSAGTNNLRASVPLSQDDIQTWADAALLKSRLSRFKGYATFQGSALAKVNSTIKLIGLSNRFDGDAFISGVIHTIDHGQWTTETKIGLSPDWFSESPDVSGPIASGLLPGVKGLQTGIVKKIYDDPDNEFRVQVEIPILGEEGKMVWARLSTFYAGNSIGAFFMPEVDDEVILGFMNDDPRYPVILGSLYSSSIPAPETPDEKNTIKTIITQSKLQIKFDDENKVITILTPGGNTMVFSDEDKGITITDQNSNKMQMNDSGIVVESQSALTLKASNEVKIQGASITISADQSAELSGGTTVSISGNQSTSITGSTQCSISSDGQMSVKGLTVMIN